MTSLEVRSKQYLETDLKDLVKESEVLPTENIERENSVIKIRNNEKWIDLFRAKNFSFISGREGSKKSFLCSILLAASHCNREVLTKIYSDNKRKTAYFDTEQSRGDVQIVEKRILKLSGRLYDDISIFTLKTYEPHLRLALIERIIADNDYGFIVIDGIRDIITDINSQEQATYITTKLLQWTEIYDCHITVVLHENKGDGKARGHIGAELLNKAQCHIRIVSQADNYKVSVVSCEKMRGGPRFDDWFIGINHEGMPYLEETYSLEGEEVF